MLCGQSTLIKTTAPGTWVFPLACRRWTCDDCRPARKAIVKAEAARGKPRLMVTLTTNPANFDNRHDRARELAHAWAAFTRYYRRKLKLSEFPYFVVFEATKRGEPHLHILTRLKYISHTLLSAFMDKRVGAPHVWLSPVLNNSHAAHYVAKYLGKATQKFEKSKRYWKTTDWCDKLPPPPPKPWDTPEPWLISKQPIGSVIAAFERLYNVSVTKIEGMYFLTPHQVRLRGPPERSQC